MVFVPAVLAQLRETLTELRRTLWLLRLVLFMTAVGAGVYVLILAMLVWIP